ncbi:MAG: methyltransferase domain-containing protein, partial [Tepidisphaeraceae bacterium]
AKAYTEKMIERFGIGAHSRVIEIGSNDGYLLQYFVQKGVPALGIEPAANIAKVARERGIDTLTRFFGVATAGSVAAERGRADLLIGNNVLAHVPDINDFSNGLKVLLAPRGVITMEFPHLVRLMEENQFDTIYHEHFSYLSLVTVEKIFSNHGLVIFDVEELATHGGSLRIYARHDRDDTKPVDERVTRLRIAELSFGLTDLATYRSFDEKVKQSKRSLLTFLIDAVRNGKSVAGYGAPGKGNTLLNYCGVRADLLPFTVDRSPHKQGKFLPGTRIPICHPDRIRSARPDFVLILPWNLKDEIMEQLSYIREWGGQFVVPIPQVQVLP